MAYFQIELGRSYGFLTGKPPEAIKQLQLDAGSLTLFERIVVPEDLDPRVRAIVLSKDFFPKITVDVEVVESFAGEIDGICTRFDKPKAP